MLKKNFVLVGAAGFVAKRHIQVIKETRNNLVAAIDVNDSIGILDNFFPKCIYLKKIDEIKKLIKKIRIDYLVVCTPNHLHRRHIEFGIKNKINVICVDGWEYKQLNNQFLFFIPNSICLLCRWLGVQTTTQKTYRIWNKK